MWPTARGYRTPYVLFQHQNTKNKDIERNKNTIACFGCQMKKKKQPNNNIEREKEKAMPILLLPQTTIRLNKSEEALVLTQLQKTLHKNNSK